MFIDLTCRCGRMSRLNTNDAGKRFQCPRCARMLTIPEAPTPLKEDTHVPAQPSPSPPPKKQAKQLDILEEIPDDPRPCPKDQRCTFCGSRKKVNVFRVWTARRGSPVQIRGAEGEFVSAPSYKHPVCHDVPSCKTCGRRINLRFRRWQLWVAFGEMVIVLIVTALGIWLDLAVERLRDAGILGKAILADVVFVILFLATLSNYLFGRTKFKHVERAIAAMMYQEIDPDATVGISSDEMRQLDPRQIEGVARWAKMQKNT